MTVSILTRSYKGVPVGNVATFPTSEETSLIAQGLASTALVTATTAGAVTQNGLTGKSAIATGASSVVVTNSLVDANSIIVAYVSQATADGTLLRVERVVPAAGSFTIFGTANATANTIVAWFVAPTTAGDFQTN
jgi:hypothetical protein